MAVRIIMIDDDDTYALLIDEMLGMRGCVASHASNGYDGLRLALLLQPDVILLDLRMPGMDGYEVAAAMRKEPELDQTRIVAVSGDVLDSDAEQARLTSAGFNGYFPKPYDSETFISELQRFLPEPLPEFVPMDDLDDARPAE